MKECEKGRKMEGRFKYAWGVGRASGEKAGRLELDFSSQSTLGALVRR
jgi:hypothetical protein